MPCTLFSVSNDACQLQRKVVRNATEPGDEAGVVVSVVASPGVEMGRGDP